MIILREVPDFLGRRASPADVVRREAFCARWRGESVVFAARVRRAHFEPFALRLSVRAAWGGREAVDVGSRRMVVDDDTYLVLNDGQPYSSAVDGTEEVDTLSIHFRPGLAEEIGAFLAGRAECALEPHEEPTLGARPFAEHLRPHDTSVSPLLDEIRERSRDDRGDPMLVEQLVLRLLERLLFAEAELRRAADAFAAVRGATRAELYRRVNLAADFIHSNYTRPISLDDIAAAARLSKYYLVRLFAAAHGVPPHGFLLRKRVAAARRLLAAGRLDVREVAAASGLGSRWSLYRQLRKQLGVSAQGLRRHACQPRFTLST